MPLRVDTRRFVPDSVDVPLLVLALRKSPALTPPLSALDTRLGGAIGRTLQRRDFRGGRDEVLHLSGAPMPDAPQRILLVGLGEATDLID